MNKTITLLFLCFSSVTFAQKTEIDSVVSKEIAIMKARGISEFFFKEKFCDGCIMHNRRKQKCNFKDSDLYVFWKEENNSYFRKLNKCDTVKVKLAAEILVDFDATLTIIKNESVKSYLLNKNTIRGCSHTTYSKYYFIINEILVTMIFDDYSLTTDSEQPNINFAYNNALELIKLDKVCEKIIHKNR
jgi:hypothetical protein